MIDVQAIVFISTIAIFLLYSIKQNSIAKDQTEFTLSGRGLSASGVAFIIIGTLVGGASTIGTAQMAYEYGYPALIFTFSSAFACLILGLFFASNLREAEPVTIVELIGKYFDHNLRRYLSIFALTGLLLQTVAQFMAASSIIRSNKYTNELTATLITAFFILFFAVLFGSKGASFLGKYKLYMLYFIGILSTILIFSQKIPLTQLHFNDYGKNRFAIDTISTIIGVLSTQTYLQAIFSAKDIKAAKNGALLSAILIPPIGIMFYLIGIHMKSINSSVTATSSVLPLFIETYFHPLLGSVFLAFLFIISVGTASGLFFGSLTMLFEDYIKIVIPKINTMIFYRLIGIILISIPVLISISNLKSSILEWSYMSMGLRGSSIFLPLLAITFNIKNRPIYILFYLLPIIYLTFLIIR
ncbi:MAG: hypothetical protein K6348_05675 [Deferribacterales bacterium]